jgi:hypothetical protein
MTDPDPQATAQPVEANVVTSSAPAPAAEQPVPAAVWAYGRHDRQVPLSGALVDDPTLGGSSLTPTEWQRRVDAYLSKPA